MNIVYSFDDKYAAYAGISLFSLLDNNKDIPDLTIYIVGEKLTGDSLTRLKSLAAEYHRNIIFIGIDEVYPKIYVTPSFGKSAYGRLFLSNFLDVDNIFYFDCDTIINGSLLELSKIDIDGFLVAGTQDTVNPYYLSDIGLGLDDRYINSGGVMVINLKLWREMDIESKIINFIKKFDGNPPHNDQGTINYVCKGYVKILNPRYNLMNPMFMFTAKRIKKLFRIKKYYSQNQLDEAIKAPIVIHYTSEFFNRPWFENCTHPFKDTFLSYMKESLWLLDIKEGKFSRNSRIQNFVYHNCPFFVYKMMIRYIEFKHSFK